MTSKDVKVIDVDCEDDKIEYINNDKDIDGKEDPHKDPNESCIHLLSCTVCKRTCHRGIIMKCCKAQACKGCAYVKAKSFSKCWLCETLLHSTDFETDRVLSLAVKQLKEGKKISRNILQDLEERFMSFLSLMSEYSTVMGRDEDYFIYKSKIYPFKSDKRFILDGKKRIRVADLQENEGDSISSDDQISLSIINCKLYKKSSKILPFLQKLKTNDDIEMIDGTEKTITITAYPEATRVLLFQGEPVQPVLAHLCDLKPGMKHLEYYYEDSEFRCEGRTEVHPLFNSTQALAIINFTPRRLGDFYHPLKRAIPMDSATFQNDFKMKISESDEPNSELKKNGKSFEFTIVLRSEVSKLTITGCTSVLCELVLDEESSDKVDKFCLDSHLQRSRQNQIFYSDKDLLVCKRRGDVKIIHELVYSKEDLIRLVIGPNLGSSVELKNGDVVGTARIVTDISKIHLKNQTRDLFCYQRKTIPGELKWRPSYTAEPYPDPKFASTNDDKQDDCIMDKDNYKITLKSKDEIVIDDDDDEVIILDDKSSETTGQSKYVNSYSHNIAARYLGHRR